MTARKSVLMNRDTDCLGMQTEDIMSKHFYMERMAVRILSMRIFLMGMETTSNRSVEVICHTG